MMSAMDTAKLSPEDCARLIRQSKRTVALTGAGISTAAGIPDFRGPDGLYNTGRYDADRVFDINYFHREPREFFRFTRDLIEVMGRIEPTFTHRFLAELEKKGLVEAVITQNIDPLHHLAGSGNVLSVHGDYASSHCLACRKEYTFGQLVDLLDEMEVPTCSCSGRGVIKPDVVFFGEAVRDLAPAQKLAASCELMLVLGSSLQVQPAAMLPELVRGTVVVVNQGPVGLSAGLNRYFIRQDLDDYFRAVAECLTL